MSLETDDKGRPKIPACYLDWLLRESHREPMYTTSRPQSPAVKLSPEILSLLEDDGPENA